MDANKIAYRPVGLVGGMLAGMVASMIVRQIWKRATDEDDPPGAIQHEYGWGEILAAAALQGAVYGVVKAAFDRGGAKAWERATGAWPGD
jgi:hypothetical protein